LIEARRRGALPVRVFEPSARGKGARGYGFDEAGR